MRKRNHQLPTTNYQLINRRWTKTRPGSVLILVIALLVLLALIGTAFLSSTQTERYSSGQNSINVEADMLIDGMQQLVTSNITGALFSNGQYRPAKQEMGTYSGIANAYIAPPTVPTAPSPGTYYNYNSPLSDVWLGDRLPLNANAPNILPAAPYWNAISWSPFPDASNNYNIDSPFDNSTNLGLVTNKSVIQSYPTYRTINGQIYPAMLYYVPQGKSVQFGGNSVPQAGPLCLTPNGYVAAPALPAVMLTPANAATYSPYFNFAASASGDGIADGGMFKLFGGPINNITYYAAIRVIDNNSAVNVSSAMSSSTDPTTTNVTAPSAFASPSATTKNQNFGFFRSNIGLYEMLQSSTAANEMNALNAYRFNGILPSSSTPSTPTLNVPVQDETATTVPRNDFIWLSAGDALEHQLTSRWGNPGYNTLSPQQKFNWLGVSQSQALAYRFSLINPNASQSLIEQILPSETYYKNPSLQSTPYSPAQAAYWYSSLFNFSTGAPPLRTVLTGSNEVSNAIPSRLGNTSAPPAWSSGSTYEFGDLVTSQGYTYACLLHNIGQTPSQTPALSGPEYWTPVPWTNQPVKTSINTATFDQLWLGFCQTMTDSITPAASLAGNGIPLWQPPFMPSPSVYPPSQYFDEKQLQMFRSSIRDNRSSPIPNAQNTGSPTGAGRVQLTPMQEMQLRAALAAINTVNMRNSMPFNPTSTNRVTRSHKITLADNNGNPVYDVEVFGTDIQPYIGQVYVKVDPNGPQGKDASFIAIQLINPYPVGINVTNSWGFATMSRANYKSFPPPLTLNSVVTGSLTPFSIFPATTTGPSSLVIYDGTVPTGKITLPTSAKQIKGLLSAIGNELVILKPRLLNGNPSSQISATDTYNEGSAGRPNLYDLVPVDQIDLTGTDRIAAPAPGYFLYKRGSNANTTAPLTNGTSAWNFTWPGFYTPYNNKFSTTGVSPRPPQYAPSAQPAITYPFSQAILQLHTEPAAGQLDFASLTGGQMDTTGVSPTAPTYNTIPMQLNNVGFPGTNPVPQASATGNMFPFGGFARNGDMLQIPYIGAYRISSHLLPPSPGTGFYEMNSVTMDSSLANDQTLQPSAALNYVASYPNLKVLPTPYLDKTASIPADAVSSPFVEQIGRFCPVGDPNDTTSNSAKAQMDFGPGYTANDPTNPTNQKIYWHYHWTRRLFDYFTVQAPHDDYFPNVDPAPAVASPSNIPAKYSAGQVLPVDNSQNLPPSDSNYYANANMNPYANPNVTNKSEDSANAGVEGLININTAPWPVLATLPFVPAGTDNIGFNQYGILTPNMSNTYTPNPPMAAPNGISDNVDLAQAIVAYRNANGPFKSIHDLYKVPAFRLENELLLLQASVNSEQGYFSGGPFSSLTNPTPRNNHFFDFQERFLLLNNISNLITTRSDTFTCYVLLQGWRNAGTGNPTLAVERRAAFIVDRNPVTPLTRTLATPPKIPSQ